LEKLGVGITSPLQRRNNKMRIVLKEHETKTLKALKLMQEVRDELLKREYEDGLKAPFGNVFRFKLDSTLEKFDFLLTPSKEK